MPLITLTEIRHGQLVHDCSEVKEHLENLETALSNRIVDIDEVRQDVISATERLAAMLNYLEDF